MLPVVRCRKEVAILLSAELPKYFVKPEIDRILGEARNNDKNYLLISILWQTGARISEILNVLKSC